jgi:hypothetical protein
MRIAAAAVMLMMLTATAHAQGMQGLNLWADDGKLRDPEAEAKQQAIDKAYREKLKSQAAPAQAANDPWGNVRSTSQPAASQSKQQSNSKTR